tara:strand:+ start:4474 stop:4938 length:465 start_codon:yes stop_codon:yes gene_type:complete
MNTFYLQEIDIDVLNKKKIIQKLKKNLSYHETVEQHILTHNGMYKIKNESFVKYKIINKNYYVVENFLDKYTLLCTRNFMNKDNDIQYRIPYDHKIHTFIRIYFYTAEYSKNKMIIDLDINTNEIINIYFTSNEDENDFNFIEDISSYIDLINV